jgi:hypothetical protein
MNALNFPEEISLMQDFYPEFNHELVKVVHSISDGDLVDLQDLFLKFQKNHCLLHDSMTFEYDSRREHSEIWSST